MTRAAGAALDRTLLGDASLIIAARMGLHFPEERWSELARGLESAGQELGFTDADTLSWLGSGALTVRQIEALASHLTVGETYFFRDAASFEALEREILPPLIAARKNAGRTLRIWSAGCCTGEEAYSLAIACGRAIPDLAAWNVSILATDINPKFLAKAEAGLYSEWSFRGVPAVVRKRFFSPAPGNQLAIDPTLKKLVQLRYLNLAEDVFPSLDNHTNAMDVVFCRNVLMYFTPEHQQRVVAGLHRALTDGGCLLVNPAEANTALLARFTMEKVCDTLIYRKTARPIRAASGPRLLPPVRALAPPEPTRITAPVRRTAVGVESVAITPAPPAAESPASLLALARARADCGMLTEALASCEAAVALERTNAATHFLHAMILHELGRLGEATTALSKVLYLDQDFVLAHHALGELYKRLGKPKAAKRHLACALALLCAGSRDELVPGSEGMTRGRLIESVRAMTEA